MKKSFSLSMFFLLGVVLVFSLRVLQLFVFQQQFTPQKSSITLSVPSNAYTGIISSLTGDVKKQGRDADDFAPVASSAAMVQGESLKTANGTTSVNFENIAQVILGQNTEIAYIDGIPQEFLLQQKSGKVTYNVLDDTKTLSVRSLHMLLQVAGKAVVTVDPDAKTILVEMQYGNGKIGINDTDDNTHVYQLAQGQKAVIDDTTRKVDVE